MNTDDRSIGYFAKLASEKLGVTRNRLKHITIVLEKNGYRLVRNKNGHRIYFQEDLAVIRTLLDRVGRGDTVTHAAQELSRCHGPVADLHPVPAVCEDAHYAEPLHQAVHEIAVSADRTAEKHEFHSMAEKRRQSIARRDRLLMIRLRETAAAKRRQGGFFARLLGNRR